MSIIILNGNTYQEAERGHFEAALIDNGEMIAYTECNSVVMLSGRKEDISLWADSYGIDNIIRR